MPWRVGAPVGNGVCMRQFVATAAIVNGRSSEPFENPPTYRLLIGEMLVYLPRALDVHTSRSCFDWMSGHRPRGLGSPLTNAPAASVFSRHLLSQMEQVNVDGDGPCDYPLPYAILCNRFGSDGVSRKERKASAVACRDVDMCMCMCARACMCACACAHACIVSCRDRTCSTIKQLWPPCGAS